MRDVNLKIHEVRELSIDEQSLVGGAGDAADCRVVSQVCKQDPGGKTTTCKIVVQCKNT